MLFEIVIKALSKSGEVKRDCFVSNCCERVSVEWVISFRLAVQSDGCVLRKEAPSFIWRWRASVRDSKLLCTLFKREEACKELPTRKTILRKRVILNRCFRQVSFEAFFCDKGVASVCSWLRNGENSCEMTNPFEGGNRRLLIVSANGGWARRFWLICEALFRKAQREKVSVSCSSGLSCLDRCRFFLAVITECASSVCKRNTESDGCVWSSSYLAGRTGFWFGCETTQSTLGSPMGSF